MVHPVDSTATAGAAAKGRSSSRRLNARMRQLNACAIAGGLEVFAPWIPTDKNPADAPSSWYGISAAKPGVVPSQPTHTVPLLSSGRGF